MIEKIISWSTHNCFFVWIGILLIVAGGVWSVMTTLLIPFPTFPKKSGIRLRLIL